MGFLNPPLVFRRILVPCFQLRRGDIRHIGDDESPRMDSGFPQLLFNPWNGDKALPKGRVRRRRRPMLSNDVCGNETSQGMKYVRDSVGMII